MHLQDSSSGGAKPDPAHLVEHLSVTRWNTYRAAASGDDGRALSLYEWNLAAAAATHTVLAVVEVALRNALDRSLRHWNRQQGPNFTDEWTSTPCPFLVRIVRQRDLDTATHRASRAIGRRRRLTHDDIVAQMTFGTWRYLLPVSRQDTAREELYEQAFSASAAAPAFPYWTHGARFRGQDVDALHKLRNRVAHHEPLLTAPLGNRLGSAERVLGAVDPILSTWLRSVERITEVTSIRPATS